MGYGRLEPRAEAFLGSIGSPSSRLCAHRQLSASCLADLPTRRPTALDVVYHRHAGLPSCVTPVNTLTYYRFGSRAPLSGGPEGPVDRFGRSASPGSVWAVLRRYGNINPLSIDYACRPRLRSRLTQGGLTWPWNPWSFGGRVSHPSFATHACILTRVGSTTGFPRGFTAHTTLPYPPAPLDHEGLS